jgi:hypothetical protein
MRYDSFYSPQLNSVTIGANVIFNDNDRIFNQAFDNYYNITGKKAGTYEIIDGQWSLR